MAFKTDIPAQSTGSAVRRLMCAAVSLVLLLTTLTVVAFEGGFDPTRSDAPTPRHAAVGRYLPPPPTALAAADVADQPRPAPGVTTQSGSATIAASALRNAGRNSLVRAGGLPLLVGDTSDEPAAEIDVEVMTRDESEKLGVDGVIATVAPHASSQGSLTVGFDYTGIAASGGADYAARLRFVELPACATATPQRTECLVANEIPTTNNTRSQRITATITRAPGRASILAVKASTDGATGKYSATSLAPAGTWSAGGAAGGFSWSYPITVIPSEGGKDVLPQVQLDYTSSAVDGLVPSTNNQSSWLGTGWGYSPGFIERTYRTCRKDDTLTDTDAKNSVDLCWAGQVVTMSLNGQSSPLVRDDTSGAWTVRNNAGQQVTLEGAGPDGYNGEYWVVTTTDGVKYYFGRNQMGGEATNSAWKVRVYGPKAAEGNKPADPCHASTFAASWCDQAWRWNLDYVVDPLGNVARYHYAPETNWYAPNGKTARIPYTRGGVLSRIDYGLRMNGTQVAGGVAPYQVVFGAQARCLEASDDCRIRNDNELYPAAVRAKWQDTPVDLQCTSADACDVHSPSFFSTKRLATITTQYRYGSGWKQIDVYNLTHVWPSVTAAELRLFSIKRTAKSSIGQPDLSPGNAVEFTYMPMANHVRYYGDNPDFSFGRMTRIDGDTGGATVITYTNGTDKSVTPDTTTCTDTSPPDLAKLWENSRLCFPVQWTPPNSAPDAAPRLDLFWKYVTSAVQVYDGTGISPPLTTRYKYRGTPGWHYDDNEIVIEDERTYGQFRGYGKVETLVGDTTRITNGTADKQTRVMSTYFRGMADNPGPATPAKVQSTMSTEKVPDDPFFTDREFEKQVFLGNTSNRISTTITKPAILTGTPVGSRARGTDLDPLKSAYIGDVVQQTYTFRAGGGHLLTTVKNDHDTAGRITLTSENGTAVDGAGTDIAAQSAAPRCTTTAYAENTNTAVWIRDRVATGKTFASDCSNLQAPSAQAVLLGHTINYYDDLAINVVGTKGLLTRANVRMTMAGQWSRTAYEYVDTYSRQTKLTEYTAGTNPATARETTTTYSDRNGGAYATITVTNPVGHVTATKVLTDRGLTIETTTAVSAAKLSSGLTTTTTYDSLGRLLKVWRPGRVAPADPHLEFAYQVEVGKPLAATTYSLVDRGLDDSGDQIPYTKAKKVELLDTQGRTLQVQVQSEKGLIASDTRYDSHGWKSATNNLYFYVGSAPSPAEVLDPPQTTVHDRTQYEYDGAGRIITTKQYDRGTVRTDQTTTTAYSGDRTTTIPPAGAVTSTAIQDARGNTVERKEYSAPPTRTVDPVGTLVAGGTSASTTYTYDASKQLTTMTDAVDATWTTEYDLAGNIVRQDDPDSGLTLLGYNDAGDLIRSTSVAQRAGEQDVLLTYTVDGLGRPTKQFIGETVGGTKLTDWVYDTLQVGQPTSSTRWDAGKAYKTSATGYTPLGLSTGTSTTLPASEGRLSGTWTTSATWTTTGLMDTQKPWTVPDPTPGDGDNEKNRLPSETIEYFYTGLGKPIGALGESALVSAVSFTENDQVDILTMGPSGDKFTLDYFYDDHTHRTSAQILAGRVASAEVDRVDVGYDPSGQITRISNRQGAVGAAVRTECFDYDPRARLVQSYTTSTTACATGTVDTTQVGGSNPYWTTWQHDDVNSRTEQVVKAIAGAPRVTTSYTNGADDGTLRHAHALASTTTTTGNGTPSTKSFDYDSRGNMLTLNNANGTHSLTWTADNKLATDTINGGVHSNVYAADGSLLIKREPTATTLYLGDQEMKLSGTTVVGTRSYAFNGQFIATRTDLGWLQFQVCDPNGTPRLSWDTETKRATRRTVDPYGVQVGSLLGGSAWPTDRGFLNMPQSASTGLTHIGARDYEPTLGRFLSVDPVLAPDTPRQNNGYGYGGGNPVTYPDPTGTMLPAGDGGGGTPAPTPAPTPSPPPADSNPITAAQQQARDQYMYGPDEYRDNPYLNGGSCDSSSPTYGVCLGNAVTAIEFTEQVILPNRCKGFWACYKESPLDAVIGLGACTEGDIVSCAGLIPFPPLKGLTLAVRGGRAAAAAARWGDNAADAAAKVLSKPSSKALAGNMTAAGATRPANTAAHHIVAGSSPNAVQARGILQRYGIDINDAENGVFLPANKAAPNPTGAAVHSTVHSDAYYREVNALLSQASSRADAIDALTYIRIQLQSGRFPK